MCIMSLVISLFSSGKVCILERPQLCDCVVVFSGCVCVCKICLCLTIKHFNDAESDVCFVYSGMDRYLSELEP